MTWSACPQILIYLKIWCPLSSLSETWDYPVQIMAHHLICRLPWYYPNALASTHLPSVKLRFLPWKSMFGRWFCHIFLFWVRQNFRQKTAKLQGVNSKPIVARGFNDLSQAAWSWVNSHGKTSLFNVNLYQQLIHHHQQLHVLFSRWKKGRFLLCDSSP